MNEGFLVLAGIVIFVFARFNRAKRVRKDCCARRRRLSALQRVITSSLNNHTDLPFESEEPGGALVCFGWHWSSDSDLQTERACGRRGRDVSHSKGLSHCFEFHEGGLRRGMKCSDSGSWLVRISALTLQVHVPALVRSGCADVFSKVMFVSHAVGYQTSSW